MPINVNEVELFGRRRPFAKRALPHLPKRALSFHIFFFFFYLWRAVSLCRVDNGLASRSPSRHSIAPYICCCCCFVFRRVSLVFSLDHTKNTCLDFVQVKWWTEKRDRERSIFFHHSTTNSLTHSFHLFFFPCPPFSTTSISLSLDFAETTNTQRTIRVRYPLSQLALLSVGT